MVTFVRRPQFDDVLHDSREAWGVLPPHTAAAQWDGWSEIGFNGPIPIFHDTEQHARELAQVARDVQITKTATQTGTDSTDVRHDLDKSQGLPVASMTWT